MANPTHTRLGIDRNVLFGQAALHLGLVTSEQLRSAMIELVDAQDRSLSQILMDQGVLTLEQVLRVLDEIGDDAGEAPTHQQEPVRPQRQSRQPVARALQELQQLDQRYRIGEQIGAGGMGRILQVEDRVLQREVVMKQLLGAAQSSSLKIHRFIQEARVTSRLQHPNIVPVHELGVTDTGEVYFTMKRVAGEDLGDVIDRLRAGDPRYTAHYSLARRLGLFEQICHAVAFAHSRGVVHRDLKPENVMVGAFGELLVMDWGLARLDADAEPTCGASELDDTVRQAADLSKTLEGQVMGTPKYMAPEQARGEIQRISERTDIYSLGAILFELLALRAPFESGSIFEVMVAVTEGRFVPPGEDPRDPPIPRELTAVVRKAMETDPDDRYQTVQQLSDDIQAFLAGRSVSARRDPVAVRLLKWAKRNKAASAGIAAGLLALTVGVSGMLAYQQARTRNRVRELLSQATARLAAGDYERAEADCTRVLTLDPQSSQARRLMRQAAAGVERLTRRKALSRRITALTLRFAGEERAVRGLPRATRGKVQRWYAARTKLLATGQELLRLAPELETVRQRTTGAALALAHQLERDASWEMARLMIEQAAELGLSDQQRLRELKQLEARRSARTRRERERVRQILAYLGNKLPEEGMLEELVGEVVKMPHAHVVRLLIPAVFADSEWQRRLAIISLGKIGDRTTRARLPGELLKAGLAPVADKDYRWVLETEHRKRMAGRARDGSLEVDPVEALCLRLLQVAPGRAHEEASALVWALGRLRDARAFLVVDQKRRASWEHSVFWQDTRLPFRWLPVPEVGQRGDWWLHFTQGNFLESQDRFKEAIQAFSRALALQRDQPNVLVARGNAYMFDGQLRRSLADFDRALEINPKLPEAYDGRGNVRRRLRDFDGAIADHSQAIALAPSDYGPWNNRGIARRQKGDLAGALADYDRAIRIAPRAPGPYVNRAAVRKARGDIPGALVDLGRALELDPRDVQAWLDRALIRWEKQKDSRGALADCERAMTVDPSDIRSYLLRGEIHRYSGAPLKALSSYSRAIKLRPRDYRPYVTRGQTLLMLQRFDAAIADFDQALRLMPTSAKVRPRILQLRLSAKLLRGQKKK